MTVDGEGNIWSACWGGAQLIQFDPDGTEMSRIKFPAVQTSAVNFGGDDFTDIYVTTATFGSDDPITDADPPAYHSISTEAVSYTGCGRTRCKGKRSSRPTSTGRSGMWFGYWGVSRGPQRLVEAYVHP